MKEKQSAASIVRFTKRQGIKLFEFFPAAFCGVERQQKYLWLMTSARCRFAPRLQPQGNFKKVLLFFMYIKAGEESPDTEKFKDLLGRLETNTMVSVLLVLMYGFSGFAFY